MSMTGRNSGQNGGENDARGARGGRGIRRYFRRGPWENAATAIIGLGVVMLMQPLSLWLFSNSFAVILTGTIGFLVVSHFPEE